MNQKQNSWQKPFLVRRTRFSLKGNKRLRAIGSVSSVLFTVLLLATIVPVYYEPTNTEALTGNPVESVLTFSSINPAASVNLTVNSPDGTFATSTDGTNNTTDQRASFSIATNNYTGYTVSISSTNASGELEHGTDAIDTIPSTVTATEFANNSRSGTDLNNTWGYIPNYYNSIANTTNYYPSSTTAATLNSTSTPNSVTGTTNPDTYTIGLGIRADYATNSGTYKNSTIIVSYIANTIAYSITYDANDGTETGTRTRNMPTPNPQVGDTDLTSTILSSAEPTRNSYTFVGWCNEPTSDETCSGTTYQPGDTYGIDQTADNENVTLYAMWSYPCNRNATTIATGNTTTDAICMQDMNDTVMSTMTTGTQYQLMDIRDSKNYYFAKMNDGKVWMTQNLDLDLVTDGSIEYNHENTDLGWTVTDTNAIWTPAAATATTASGYGSITSTAPRSYDPGDVYYYTSGSTSTDTTYASLAACTGENESTHTVAECTHYHAGNYYNWSAAVATNNTNTTAYKTQYNNAPNSICPAGWRLPYGPESSANSYNEINALWRTHSIISSYTTGVTRGTYASGGFVNMRKDPLYTVRAGYKNGTSTPSNLPTYGYLWSSTVYSSSAAYAPYFYSSYPYAGYNQTRGYGYSVRCVARISNPGSLTIKYHGNNNDGGITMEDQVVEGGRYAVTKANTYTRTGYTFYSWNTQADGNGTNYSASAMYGYMQPSGTDAVVNLYAKWYPTITFNADSNVETIIIYNNSTTARKPEYIASGGSKTISAATGTEYIVTVVPKAHYKLDSWTRDSNAGTISTGNNNEVLLTSTYTVGITGETLTANTALVADPDLPYTDMRDFALADCTAAGSNVTDARDGKSYTVAKIGDYCYMLSNLRLDGGTTLHSTDSHVLADYTLPNDSGASGWKDDYCRPYMATKNREYYYNWPAATARANETSSTSTCSNDTGNSVGDICPLNWALPTYATDITPANVWNNGANPGALYTSGYFVSNGQGDIGTRGFWQSRTRANEKFAYILFLSSGNIQRYFSGYGKYVGFPVRCSRSRDTVFKVGSGIDTIIVAPKNENYKPYYANKANPILTFENATSGAEYKVTVVPESGYVLDSWTKNINAGTFSVGNNNEVLLTSTYTGGTNGRDELLVANGALANNNNNYPTMKDFALADCTVAGNNVTDTRNGKSYTVAKFGNYCYMLSNLRLDGGVELTSTDSDINPDGVTYAEADAENKTNATTFTTPTEAWTSSSQNYYCKAIMKVVRNEYYYNWYAAKANAYVCSNPTSSTNATTTNDGYALGSICPLNWTLPTYTDVTPAALWNNKVNPGALTTPGSYYSGSLDDFGSASGWWSITPGGNGNPYAKFLRLVSGSIDFNHVSEKSTGRPVRCVRGGS